VERGWCLGSEEFRQKLLAAARSLSPTHYGTERREVPTSRAERLLREEMGRLGWTAADLRQTGKGDERKLRMAARIRKETTMSLKWMAQHLAMGGWTHVSNLLGARRKGKRACRIATYKKAQIQTDGQKPELLEWAAQKAVGFYKAFAPEFPSVKQPGAFSSFIP
jgi:hypothetical protein